MANAASTMGLMDISPGQLNTILGAAGRWEQQMAFILEMMREMSSITDPQILVKSYGARMRQIMPIDASISLSRRSLDFPKYRITRTSKWGTEVNPWRDGNSRTIFDRGILGELIYRDEPTVIDGFELSPDDPAAEFMVDMKSLVAIPLYENGRAINMVVLFRKDAAGFPRENLPTQVWMANLFGRATHTLVLSNEVKTAYEAVERELKAVADIQRSLLPATLPEIDSLDLAVYYQTSRHSGGDYYDFFKLPHGQWGILIADVSGHGTPAAVLMAITHSIAHIVCDPPVAPAMLLEALNVRLAETYTNGSGNFVTAFYGVYDPSARTLNWANAGHPAPRVRRADGTVGALPMADNLPLGIEPGEAFVEQVSQFHRGDLLLFYTDGITEARGAEGAMFDPESLDKILHQNPLTAADAISQTLSALETFSFGQPLTDDRTLLAARVR